MTDNSSAESSESVLQFYPFSSVIDVGFWHTLANKKLDTLKLDDKPIDISATFSNESAPNLPPLVNVGYDSFNENYKPTKGIHIMFGKLIITNTIEDFINIDKKQLITDLGNEIRQNIVVNNVIRDPSHSLSRFLLLVYADLKKYKFHYWFAFPALCFPQNTRIIESPKSLSSIWSENQISTLHNEYKSKLDVRDQSYFLICENNSDLTVHPISEYFALKKITGAKVHFSYIDPCAAKHPGWPLRNYLAFICYHFKLSECSVIAFRVRAKSAQNSILFEVRMSGDTIPDTVTAVGWEKNENHKLLPRVVNLGDILDPIRLAENAADLNLKLMRWRLLPSLNLEKIFATRCLLLGAGTLGCYVARALLAWRIRTITFVDNSNVSYSNPVRQALYTFDDSVDGGRPKAMAAAQALKNISPSVNATGIELSIPMPGHPMADHLVSQVRKDVETLERLIEEHDVIFLLMDTRESRWLPTLISAIKNKLVINAALGFDSYLVLRHGLVSNESKTDVEKYCCDSVCCKCCKECERERLNVEKASTSQPREICIHLTGGSDAFDLAPMILYADTFEDSCASRSSYKSKKIYGSSLGCYFCNDVVAPRNSTRDRTLDQQCTVTRPGVSMIASALAVELMVSVLQHPMGGLAPAMTVSPDECCDSDAETALGIIPHQIRGFLSRFQQISPTSERFDKCTACSDKILESYRADRFEFLLRAFNDSNYIEELTGLKQLHIDSNLQDIWTLSDTDDDN